MELNRGLSEAEMKMVKTYFFKVPTILKSQGKENKNDFEILLYPSQNDQDYEIKCCMIMKWTGNSNAQLVEIEVCANTMKISLKLLLQKLEINIPYDWTILFLYIYPKDSILQKISRAHCWSSHNTCGIQTA